MRDDLGVQPLFAIIAVVLVAAFIIVAMAMVAANEHSPKDPGGDGDVIGYLSISADISYGPGVSATTPATYSMVIGVGTHEGQPNYEFMFFTLPSALTALGEDIAVTFNVTYPDGTVLSDTQVRANDGDGAYSGVIASDDFLVYEAGTYGITAYLFVDGEQIGNAYVTTVTVDGVNWNY